MLDDLNLYYSGGFLMILTFIPVANTWFSDVLVGVSAGVIQGTNHP